MLLVLSLVCDLPAKIKPSLSKHDSLAEWSKALASGASPQGRGFEPHSCHFSFLDDDECDVCIAIQNKEKLQQMVPRGLEPRTLRLLAVRSNQLSYETSYCHFPQFPLPQMLVLAVVVAS